ncbi:MAG: hypothetical protein GEU93_22015 [Propionibacteriales bacterium]|nr:hypothetical protein [Propionibacteriales bacterium]
MTTHASSRLAEFVTSLRPAELPESTVAYTKVLIADTVGAGLFGSTTEAGRICWEHAVRTSAPGPAAVWGRSGGMVAEAAALVNGTQAHAYELDDYHPGAKLHPGAVVVPSAMAAAARSSQPVSGMELLTAVVLGYEVMIRVSLAATSSAVRRRGWHLTGIAGPLGAAAAAARIGGLDHDATLHALGIAGSHSAGLFAFSREGAMTKRLHAGRASSGGLDAATLAANGFTGPSDVLEATDGGLLNAISDEAEPSRIVEGLGDSFLVDQTAIKPYACCGSLHSSIDAVIRLANAHDVRPHDIKEITAYNSRLVDRQCGFDYRGTGGALEAQMSLQYCLAVSATDRRCFTEQFTPQRRADHDVRELAQRVRFEVDPDIDAVYPHRFPARVGIAMVDRSEHEEFVSAPTGSEGAPFGWDQMTEKFRATTAGVLSESEQSDLLGRIEAMDDAGDIRGLLPVG